MVKNHRTSMVSFSSSPPQNPPTKKAKTSEDGKTNDDYVHFEPQKSFPRYLLFQGTDDEKPMRKVSPMKGHLIIKGMIGTTVSKVIRQANGDLIIGVVNEEQERNAMKMTTFDTAPVLVTLHKTLNHKKGVIRCPALKDIPEKEIAEDLADQGVCEARKIFMKKEGELVPSATVILTFAMSVLPKEIKAGYLNLKVDPYIPNPLRCFRCHRYGHTSDKCKRKAICARCGSEEHINDRECTETPHCINCQKDHSAYSKDCSQWLLEKNIQRLRVTENLSFFEARRQLTPAPMSGPSYSSVAQPAQKVPTTEEILKQIEYLKSLLPKELVKKQALPTKATKPAATRPKQLVAAKSHQAASSPLRAKANAKKAKTGKTSKTTAEAENIPINIGQNVRDLLSNNPYMLLGSEPTPALTPLQKGNITSPIKSQERSPIKPPE